MGERARARRDVVGRAVDLALEAGGGGGQERQEARDHAAVAEGGEEPADPGELDRAEEVLEVQLEEGPLAEVGLGVGLGRATLHEGLSCVLAGHEANDPFADPLLSRAEGGAGGGDHPLAAALLGDRELAVVGDATRLAVEGQPAQAAEVDLEELS